MRKLFLMVLGFVFCCASVTQADLLILHNNTPNKPNPVSQLEVDKLKRLADGSKLTLVFKGVPWKRALVMIEKGVADGLINASYKKDRAQYAVYPMKEGKPDSSRRLNPGKTYYIYKNKNSSISWDGTRFSQPDGPVAAKDGYAVIEDLKKHPNIELVIKIREEQIIADLVRGKIAAYAAMETEAEAIKKIPNFEDKIAKEPNPIRQKDYYIIFSKLSYNKKKDEIEKLWDLLKNQ